MQVLKRSSVLFDSVKDMTGNYLNILLLCGRLTVIRYDRGCREDEQEELGDVCR